MQLAIEDIGFGTINKLYFKFENHWWPHDSVHILWRNKDIENLEENELWMSTIIALASVDNAPNILSVWYYENKDVSVVEHLSDDTMTQLVMKFLRKIFKDKYEIPEAHLVGR
jgi:hypothetical protein